MSGRPLHPRDAPPEPPGLNDILIVENIPVIPPSKIDKLSNALRKKFGGAMSRKAAGLHIELPLSSDGSKTAGYAFIEFANAAECKDVKSWFETPDPTDQSDRRKFDKKHTFKLTNMGEFDAIMDTPEEWPEPDTAAYDENDVLDWWLHDKQCRDQFVTRVDRETSVYWARRSETSLVVERTGWSERGVLWSPKGNYLATFHPQGIKLYGGKHWGVRDTNGRAQPNQRFLHPGVEEIDFSPCETYLVTFSPTGPTTGSAMIWDIATGQKKSTVAIKEKSPWPILKWSHDGKYFAMLKDKKEGETHHQAIRIFETPSFALLDGKSLKVPNVQAFAWSPSDNIMSFWVPETAEGNMPAKIMLTAIPSRQEVSTNNMVLLKDCRMVWQKSGDYLAVSAERWSNRNKKNSYTQLMVFSMREKMIPCERIKIEDKIQSVALEPVGGRIAILVGETPRIQLKLFDHVEGKLTETKCFEKVTASSLHWSPRGQYLVAAGLGSTMQGVLEFFDAKNGTSFNVGEHFMASGIHWDPTGRYVVSIVSSLHYQTDTGYYIWTFQGKLVKRELQKSFFQLLWRPRPTSLLSKQKISSIKKNLKQYHADFEAEDRLAATAASEEVLRKRRELMEAWEDFQDQVLYYASKNKDKLASLRDAENDNEVLTEITEIVEVPETEEVEVFTINDSTANQSSKSAPRPMGAWANKY